MAAKKKVPTVQDSGISPSGDDFLEREQKEQQRRWKATVREVVQVLKHIPDIRLSGQEGLSSEVEGDEKKRLAGLLFQALLEGEDRPGLKRTVVRRMADKMGRYMLRNRLTSTPGFHELGALVPWWASQLPVAGIGQIRDIGLAYFLNGSVLPLQTVWKELLEAREVYVGHCVCRSSGIAADIAKGEKVQSLLDREGNDLLLDRILRCYERLKDAGELEETDPAYVNIFEEMRSSEKGGATRPGIDFLLQATYPEWEFLPVHERYTPNWIRSMYNNRKARPLHKELAFELATSLFFSRRIIFTSMRMVDSPYTICSCPTPEHGGGCVLTNWYYYGQSNASLLPNEEYPKPRHDPDGEILPCRFFEVRAQKGCLGCGCLHDAPEPRDLRSLLNEADRVLEGHRLC